tara:strand:- start:384 stop:1178 length:795 start_codon:yes stop_codon:yes gene_type:complete
MTDFAEVKKKAKKLWATFGPFENVTGLAAPKLIEFARIKPGVKVLDVGCGTGVLALTAARHGAMVSGSDLTPELITQAINNASISNFDIDFQVADVEDLPYQDNSFDFVLSQFGHMFAPRPDVCSKEMLRVLKPGGIIAFSTWPPELLTGRTFGLVGKYAPKPPKGVSAPVEWGEPSIIVDRLGDKVSNITFHRSEFKNPALSPEHMRNFLEAYIGPVSALVNILQSEPKTLAKFRLELDNLLSEYFIDNGVIQSYLMTRAVKI